MAFLPEARWEEGSAADGWIPFAAAEFEAVTVAVHLEDVVAGCARSRCSGFRTATKRKTAGNGREPHVARVGMFIVQLRRYKVGFVPNSVRKA